jgi:colicin import membrane protein
MHASADRLEFAPPPQPGPVRAFVLAVIAHVLLMLALTWGINWNRESENQAAEAELWSSVPQQAAPKLVEAPPPPPPPPVEKKVEATPPPPAPTVKEPDIALEREKKKQQLAKQRQEELEKQKKLEAKKKLEEEKREKLAEKKEAEERKKKEELAKAAKTQKQQREQEAKLAALRAEQMRRIQGLAGATGGPTATGNAQRSSGPSDSYAGRIRARVKPNIVFTDDIAGNPTAEVEVRMAPDGTITSRKIVKSSGVKSWDETVLRALDKTEVLPRDVDGRIHTPLIIEFKPKG